jgi:hypothetical protein
MYTEHDVEIVENALALVADSIGARPELLETFYAFSEEPHKTVDDLVLALLLHCPHAPIRACAAKYLHILTTKYNLVNGVPSSSSSSTLRPPHTWLLRLLLDHIPHSNDSAATHSQEFFRLLAILVNDLLVKTTQSSNFSIFTIHITVLLLTSFSFFRWQFL